jgi:carboxylesterase
VSVSETGVKDPAGLRGDKSPGDLRGDKSPLWLRGGGRGVLCLHGFTGTPFEIRPLAEGLAGQGFTVVAPALAGHCGTVADLCRTRWPDWLESADRALDELLAAVGGGPVGIAGFSLGGLLALHLARLRPQSVAALVVMAAPLRLRRLQVAAVKAVCRLPSFLRRGPLIALPKWGGFDVMDERMQQQNPGLPALPLDGVASMIDLGAVVRGDLPNVKTPALVVHGERDRTVPVDDSLELVGSLASEVVERLFLPRSGHLVGIDLDRSTLIEAATRFLNTHVPAPRAATGVASS